MDTLPTVTADACSPHPQARTTCLLTSTRFLQALSRMVLLQGELPHNIDRHLHQDRDHLSMEANQRPGVKTR